MKPLSQLLHEQVYFEEVYPLVRTGFASLDERIPFLRKGMLTILAARPAMGKTTLALQIAGNATVEGKTVAFFTQQKSAFDLSLLLTEIMCIPGQAELRLFIEDRVSNIQDVADVLRAAECSPDLVVVDQLQDFCWKSSKGSPCFDAGKMGRALRELAGEMHTAVLCVSNLTRSPEFRKDHWPRLTDIPHWSAIERYADFVCLLYRQGYYDFSCERTELAELFLARRVGEYQNYIGHLTCSVGILSRFRFFEAEYDETGSLV